MPVFEYRCDACERTDEVILLGRDEPPESCAECGGPLRRLWSRVGVQLVGWGFSRTDSLVADSPRRSDFKKVRDKASELFD